MSILREVARTLRETRHTLREVRRCVRAWRKKQFPKVDAPNEQPTPPPKDPLDAAMADIEQSQREFAPTIQAFVDLERDFPKPAAPPPPPPEPPRKKTLTPIRVVAATPEWHKRHAYIQGAWPRDVTLVQCEGEPDRVDFPGVLGFVSPEGLTVKTMAEVRAEALAADARAREAESFPAPLP